MFQGPSTRKEFGTTKKILNKTAAHQCKVSLSRLIEEIETKKNLEMINHFNPDQQNGYLKVYPHVVIVLPQQNKLHIRPLQELYRSDNALLLHDD